MVDSRKILLLVSLVMVWPLPALSSPWADLAPAGVAQAANDGLPRFLDAIPDIQLQHFGFASRDEYAATTLGAGFRTYSITPLDILSFQEGDDISSVAYATDLWRFPVVCSGVPRTVLTVDLMGGEWETVDLEGSGLAADMGRAAEYLAGLEGYEARYLRIYQAGCAFIWVTNGDRSYLVPLTSAAIVLNLMRPDGTYEYTMVEPAQAFRELASVVRKNLEMLGEK